MNYWSIFFLPLVFIIRHLFTNLSGTVGAVNWKEQKWIREAYEYSEDDLSRLALVGDMDYDVFNRSLDEILKVRVPGTPQHAEVKKFIMDVMKDLGWDVTTDKFESNTVVGPKVFTNIIATHNPKACERLVVACHYDSKVSDSGAFLGAVDSAVPCAMMISMAASLKQPLDEKKDARDISLQFIFFDGEEAFVRWSSEDSLYGSRHLAQKWNRQRLSTNQKQICSGAKRFETEIDRIQIFVLLDLLGASNPSFYSFFPQTSSLYKWLVDIEESLDRKNLLEEPRIKRRRYFNNRALFNQIEDDHIPFLRRDVPILHIIPTPFPSVWHTDRDNRDSLDHPTINNLIRIFRVFISKYLHLKIEQ